MPKGAWKEYVDFSKKERVAVFMLLALIGIFVAVSYFYTPVFTSPVVDKDVQAKLNALSAGKQSAVANADDSGDSATQASVDVAKENTIKKEQFYFDPNTLSVEGWKKLGFRDKTIANIIQYRDGVGKFKTPADLYNVPRIRKKAVEEVLPFVRIGLPPPTNNTIATLPAKQVSGAVRGNGTGYKTINVNTAAADDFMAFPGMTDAVANRIVKFRTSINGFNSVDDVAKTYGLHDSTFKIMRPYLTITPK